MLNYFGANVTSQGTTASIEPDPVLNGREIKVPGDISSTEADNKNCCFFSYPHFKSPYNKYIGIYHNCH